MTTATRSDLYAPGGSPIDQLRTSFRGTIIVPGDADYDTARRIHDLGFDNYPAVIARVTDGRDVAEGIRFARANDYPIAVRSGGHSVAGFSSVDGACVIDLSGLKAISIDPETRIARVQPGVRSGELAAQAQVHGLALTTGDVQSVGLGGLTLGGGIGWMVRKFGLTIDNLISAEMVTAQGEIVRASANENQELFWGLRGGGGNFGIVTEFEYRLSYVPQIVGGALVLAATPDVIRGYVDYAPNAPEGLSIIGQVMHAPPAPFIPEEMVGQTVFFVMPVFVGDLSEADAAIAPLRALGDVMVDVVGPMPYPGIFQFTAEAANPLLAVVRQLFSDDLSDEAIQSIIDAVEASPSPITMVQIRGLGGAYGRVPAEETAFAHRERKLMTNVLSIWLDPEEDRRPHEQWALDLWSKLEPECAGAYSNFLENEGEERIRVAYPEETYRRLAELKRRYDPENIFSLNQNIRPA